MEPYRLQNLNMYENMAVKSDFSVKNAQLLRLVGLLGRNDFTNFGENPLFALLIPFRGDPPGQMRGPQ